MHDAQADVTLTQQHELLAAMLSFRATLATPAAVQTAFDTLFDAEAAAGPVVDATSLPTLAESGITWLLGEVVLWQRDISTLGYAS